MLTFRKALILAAFVVTCIFVFQSTHSRSSKYIQETAEGLSKSTPDIKSTEAKVAKILQGSSAQPTGAALQSLKTPADQSKQAGTQQPIKNPGNTLLDRLRYQFPYEPTGTFPGYIWQTWKVSPSSGDFADRLRAQEASWSTLHQGMIHEVVTDDVAANLVRYLYASVPEVVEAYKALPVPVLKADFFRYLILLARGGIYSDIDTRALKPATDWLPKTVPPSSVGLIVGIEADPDRPDWAQWYSRRIQFCQWTIQAKPGHPVLRSIVARITDDTLRMKKAKILSKEKMDKSIVEFTGPAIWTDQVFNYFNDPQFFKVEPGANNITWESFSNMEKPRKVGDVVVLPITSFSPGVQTMNAKNEDDPMAFVKHDFEGEK